jgi:hypothetical protein
MALVKHPNSAVCRETVTFTEVLCEARRGIDIEDDCGNLRKLAVLRIC